MTISIFKKFSKIFIFKKCWHENLYTKNRHRIETNAAGCHGIYNDYDELWTGTTLSTKEALDFISDMFGLISSIPLKSTATIYLGMTTYNRKLQFADYFCF